MPDEERPDRADAIVHDLLRGRRLRARPDDAPQRDAILAAARLAGARERYPRMTPAFRNRLQEMLSDKPRNALSRRTALVAGVVAAAGALGGVGLTRALEPSYEPAPPKTGAPVQAPAPGLVIDPRPGRWIDVAAMSDLKEGAPSWVKVGDAFGVYLVRAADKVSALSDVCSHLPCSLHYVADRQVLNCPCHNANFDLAGRSLSETYPLPPLAQARVRIVGGRVQVMGV